MDKEILYISIFLEKTKKFIGSLTSSEQGKIAAQIEMMELGQFEAVHTKLLKSPIKELVIGKYRITFFIEKHWIYFIFAFIKKTQKTPKQYIEQSEKIYKEIKRSHSKNNEK